MGLDMYAYVGRPGQYEEYWSSGDYVRTANGGMEWVNDRGLERPRELAYWRKHPNLQGWMRQLWESRGRPGADTEDPSFNGVEFELTWDDIDQLERDILAGCLPKTQGFFYGDDADEYYREQDLEFCAAARADLFLGQRVFYNCSW
jgi:hypothetical protein